MKNDEDIDKEVVQAVEESVSATAEEIANGTSTDPHFWLEEYKLVHSQFQKAIELLIKVFIISIGVHGLLLKLALDKNSTDLLLQTLSIFAIAVCILMLVACLVAWRVFRRLHSKRTFASQKLQGPLRSAFYSGEWAVLLYCTFNGLALCAWCYVIL